MTPGRTQKSKSKFAYHRWFAWEQRCSYSSSPPCVPHERSLACACLNEPSSCLHLFRQRSRNQQAQTKSSPKMTSATTAAGCGTGRRGGERQREGGEQLTRSDTGKRGDLIAQLGKSTGRKQQERLVPSVWPGSLLLLVGPSVAFLSSLPSPLLPFSPPPSRTAACHGSLHRNKMISSHLLMNTGHHGSHAKAGPFVLDRDHWYPGRRRICCSQMEESILFWFLLHIYVKEFNFYSFINWQWPWGYSFSGTINFIMPLSRNVCTIMIFLTTRKHTKYLFHSSCSS